MKVLVIENDESILEVMYFIITGAGFVFLRSNYLCDPEEIAALRPDLIFIEDQLYREHKGRNIAKVLKRSSSCKSIKIILMTTDNRIQEGLKSCEVDNILVKPFEINQLEEILFYTSKLF